MAEYDGLRDDEEPTDATPLVGRILVVLALMLGLLAVLVIVVTAVMFSGAGR